MCFQAQERLCVEVVRDLKKKGETLVLCFGHVTVIYSYCLLGQKSKAYMGSTLHPLVDPIIRIQTAASLLNSTKHPVMNLFIRCFLEQVKKTAIVELFRLQACQFSPDDQDKLRDCVKGLEG